MFFWIFFATAKLASQLQISLSILDLTFLLLLLVVVVVVVVVVLVVVIVHSTDLQSHELLARFYLSRSNE